MDSLRNSFFRQMVDDEVSGRGASVAEQLSELLAQMPSLSPRGTADEIGEQLHEVEELLSSEDDEEEEEEEDGVGVENAVEISPSTSSSSPVVVVAETTPNGGKKGSVRLSNCCPKCGAGFGAAMLLIAHLTEGCGSGGGGSNVAASGLPSPAAKRESIKIKHACPTCLQGFVSPAALVSHIEVGGCAPPVVVGEKKRRKKKKKVVKKKRVARRKPTGPAVPLPAATKPDADERRAVIELEETEDDASEAVQPPGRGSNVDAVATAPPPSVQRTASRVSGGPASREVKTTVNRALASWMDASEMTLRKVITVSHEEDAARKSAAMLRSMVRMDASVEPFQTLVGGKLTQERQKRQSVQIARHEAEESSDESSEFVDIDLCGTRWVEQPTAAATATTGRIQSEDDSNGESVLDEAEREAIVMLQSISTAAE